MPTAAIDMVGTFFSLEPLRQRLSSLGVPEGTLELWFAEALRDQLAISLSGAHAPLATTLSEALPRTLATLGRIPRDISRLEQVLKGFSVLNPVEGATRACAQLAASGWRLLALTDGSEDHTRSLLDRAGLLRSFDAVLSSDVVQSCRPHPDIYGMARELSDGECWVITAHAWDAAGAKRAGLRTLWLSNREKRWLNVMPHPDVQASNFDQAMETLLCYSGAGSTAAVHHA